MYEATTTEDRTIVTLPPRCQAVREPTLWEMFKYRLLGPVRGFDPVHETWCLHREGHEEFGYQHEDVSGRQWSGEVDGS